MGQIWRNRTLYSGVNQSRLMMTQAEYDQLPSSEKNDGQFRVITDAPSVIDLIYPVGSVYISINNVNPGTYLTGTTWESFGTGKTLVGVDTAQTEFNTVQKTGGEKAHTLVPNELPQRAMVQARNPTSAAKATSAVNASWTTVSAAASGTLVTSNYDAGANGFYVWGESQADAGGKSHNNLQPYITVYMWKRTH